jgi:hypothetical protein
LSSKIRERSAAGKILFVRGAAESCGGNEKGVGAATDSAAAAFFIAGCACPESRRADRVGAAFQSFSADAPISLSLLLLLSGF